MNIHLITPGDYLLLPVYLFLFYKIAIRYKNKKFVNDPALGRIFMLAFSLKIFSALMFALITEYYFKNGDTYIYFEEGSKLYKWILQKGSNISYLFSPAPDYEELKNVYADPDNVGFADNEGNFMPIRLIALFSFFTFNKYFIISLLFSFFSFTGLWKLYQAFSHFYPALKKEFAISFLFIPSVLFWGSSVLKDPICLGCIGWVMNGFFNIYLKKDWLYKNIFLIIFFSVILYLTKSYIAIALYVSVIFWVVAVFKEKIAHKTLRNLLFPFLLLFTVLSVYILLQETQDALGKYALDNFVENVKFNQMNYAASEDAAGGSYFDIGEINPTLTGMLKIAPKVINATFFRPYIWESKNIMMLFSGIESMALLFFAAYVLFKLRFVRFFSAIFSQPLVLLCFLFSIVLGYAVGITTPNFGTLMRYKIPCIPFFTAMLFIALYTDGFRKKVKTIDTAVPPAV